jgi:RHH-type rel operon transcriptional repressor/antitoxin RelB
VTIALHLPPELEQRLQDLATRTGRSKASFAREATLRFLEDLEDEQLALERLKQPGKRWTLDELEHGLTDSQDDPSTHFDEWASEPDAKRYGSL